MNELLLSLFTPSTILLISLASVFIAVLFWLYSNFVFMKSYKDLPSFQVWPVLTYWIWLLRCYRDKFPRAFILRIMGALCKMYEKQKVFLLWLGLRPVVFFLKPDVVEVLLNNSRAISKSMEYKFLEPWLGTGLLTSTGDKWRSHRKLLTPTFHFHILENFLLTFNEEATVLTKKLENEVKKPWIDIVPMITLCTLDIICQTAMGVHLNIQSGRCKEYVETLDQISGAFMYRITRPFLWPDFIYFYCCPSGWKYRKNIEVVQDFTRKVIKEKKESLLKQKSEQEAGEVLSRKPKRKAFLELLLEHHLNDTSFTEENIREEVDTFMIEGHDTTGMSMSFTLYELGRNPEIQEKVFEELDRIFGSDKEREVTSDDLKQMKYLECTIKESLRLYPSVSFIARQLTENLEVENYTLTPGCTCFICIFMLHQDPEYFPNPAVFDPDRFLLENSNKRHPYAYIPFSAGPRNCIGQKFALMEEKTMLAHILRKFTVISLDPRDRVNTMAGLVLKNAEPLRIKLELRETEEVVM